MAFDETGARRAGYSEAEIVDHLGGQRNFDVKAAREAGYSDRDILGFLTAPPERSMGERALRVAGNLGAGFNSRLAQVVGTIPDLYNSGLRAVGLPALAPDAYTNAIQSGINTVVGEPPKPENTAERIAHGAGAGLADVATVAIPATAVANATRAGTFLNGVAGGLAAQPTLQAASGAIGGAVGEVTDSPLAGTVASLAVPAVAGAASRLRRPVSATLGREEAALAAAAEREGIPLTPAQRTGSRPLATMEAQFETLPLTSRTAAETRGAQQAAFNRAVLERAGIQADRASPEVLAANSARLGAEFDRLSAATTVQLDKGFLRDLGGIVTRYGDKLPSQQRPVFTAYVRDIMNARQNGGTMAGTTYQTTRSDLTRQANEMRASDPTLSRALRGLRDALDDAAGRSIPADMRDAWNAARRQYANQQVIQRAASGAGQGGAVGDVSASGLRTALATGNNRRDYALGIGDLNELARIGQQFIRPQIPNSGTPERAMMNQELTGGALGLGGTAMGVNPLTAAAVGAGSIAMPRAVQMLYGTRPVQNWLTAAPPTARPTNALAGVLGARVVDHAVQP